MRFASSSALPTVSASVLTVNSVSLPSASTTMNLNDMSPSPTIFSSCCTCWGRSLSFTSWFFASSAAQAPRESAIAAISTMQSKRDEMRLSKFVFFTCVSPYNVFVSPFYAGTRSTQKRHFAAGLSTRRSPTAFSTLPSMACPRSCGGADRSDPQCASRRRARTGFPPVSLTLRKVIITYKTTY